jgi:hypothetical protein
MQQHPATVAQAGIGEPVSGGEAAVNVSWTDCHEMLTKSEPSVAEHRALRGGSWSLGASDCRASDRSRSTPGGRYFNLGFRVVLSPPQDRFPSAISPSNSLPLSSPEKK